MQKGCVCIYDGERAKIMSESTTADKMALTVGKGVDPEKVRWGEAAPDWLRHAETYLLLWRMADWPLVKTGKFSFVTHVPHDRAIMDKLNAMNIRPVPYIQMIHLQNYAPQFGIDLRRHMDWIAINKRGIRKKSHYWQSADLKNWYETCPYVEAYISAIESYVKKLMRWGAYGVFFDCITDRWQPEQGGFKCYGEEYGVHKHKYHDLTAAYGAIFKRLRRAIKAINSEGALLGNGNPFSEYFPEPWVRYFDAYMLESYVCSFLSKKRWFDWDKTWNRIGKCFRPAVRAGKQLQALSYLGGTGRSVRDEAFFCYASARLAGFVWSGGTRGGVKDLMPLYAVRLGRPKTHALEINGIHYRIFEDGFVALNPSKTKKILLPGKRLPAGAVYDLFQDSWISCAARAWKIEVPANSGRVYLFMPKAAEKNALSEDDIAPENQITAGPKHMLKIITKPLIGDVCFRVDGHEYYTRGGWLGADFMKGALFGMMEIYFDRSGSHEVEIVDKEFSTAICAGEGAIWKKPEPGAQVDYAAHRAPVDLEKKSGSLVWMGIREECPRLKLKEGMKGVFLKWKGGKGRDTKVKINVKGQTELTVMFSVS